VPGTQAKVKVTFEYDAESDHAGYPVPPNVPIEGGSASAGDRHVLVVDHDNCVLYELYSAYPQPDGSWARRFRRHLRFEIHALRPAGWTSADAAGLPIFPGLVRYEEVAREKFGTPSASPRHARARPTSGRRVITLLRSQR